MERLFDLTVAEASDRIRRREISSVALAESLLNRIERLEPILKAWVTIDREHVLIEAHQRDRELEEGNPRGPLHGIPIGLKDIFYTAGMKTTAGSKIYADFVPTHDSTCAARLKQAGAIILGKATTTEFASGEPAATLNPWDPAHTPGGSSTGSAVAVAARMCPAALGSQTGGSTLKPASYNGTVGLKATYGRVSRHGVIPVSWSLDTVGILVRTVEDAAILLGAVAGHDPHDPSSSKESVPDYRAALGSQQSPPRLGLIQEFFLERCDGEVRQHTEEVFEILRRAGASMENVELPGSFVNCYAVHRIVQHVERAAFHEQVFDERGEDFSPRMRGQIEAGMLIPSVRYVQAQRMRRRLREEIAAMAGRVDALITPTTPTPAPKDLSTSGDPVFQTPWTTAGLPTVTIPSGTGRSGMPLGIQLVGSPFGEAPLLAVARWCETALGVELVPPLLT